MRGVSHSAIVAAGFRIGDHTITHPYLIRLSDGLAGAVGVALAAARWTRGLADLTVGGALIGLGYVMQMIPSDPGSSLVNG